MCHKPAPHADQSCNCGCSGMSCFAPGLWSKKKQVQVVKDSIACLQSQVKDLEERLNELQQEK
ncbi:MAG: hypothetical protein KKE44_14520 [Proteobacteria bacterium]|nr:hypothetical protein [Pseudomonadota bacterium]MBU1583941.1 hypothetical protein [Pseudomonadota bacterium]MBU2454963.1 hypothetical protein [Pseudomonadota bacterium]MBU2629503.1 hypothetical protein [Pseudomonadota bacterium]